MYSPKTTHIVRSLFSYVTRHKLFSRNRAKSAGRRHSVVLTLALALAGMGLIVLPSYYAVKANASPGITTSLSESYLSVTRSVQFLMHKLFGAAPVTAPSSSFACNLTQQVTVSGCYYTAGASKATVSVEVGWTGAVNGDTITVSLDSGAQTRIIKPESLYDSGGGSANAGPIVTPQVVAFEITADGLSHTITSTLTGSSSCSFGPTNFVAPPACAPNLCTAGELGGTVYFDFNGDGIRQSGELVGVPNVTISAYDSSNTLVGTATSNSEGRYEFSAANANAISAASYPLRLEVTSLPASGFNTTTRIGTNNGSSVQFVNAAQCNRDVSVLDQAEFCQENPLMVIPCYVNGDPLPAGTAGDGDALITFPYLSSGAPAGITNLASARKVGSLWGVAYNRFTKKAFSSAMLKRHVGLGPLGLGGIYVSDMTALATSNFIDVTTLGIDLGQASVPSNVARGLVTDKTQPSRDTAVFSLVGKVGMGDLDISEDGSKLWFVNMNDKKLYSIDITAYNASNTLPTAANVASTTIPAPSCTNGTSRPFGTKIFRGKVYVGTVCDASSGTRSNLSASVSAYDPTTLTWSSVFSFPLTYPKGYAIDSRYTGWYAWTDTFTDLLVTATGQNGGTGITYPEPLLADIEFDTDGTMVLGFADRQALQLGYGNYSPNVGDNALYYNFVGGDVLRAFFSNNVFILENNAKAGPNSGYGVGNNQGPGFGEFYNDSAACCHTETFVGGLALKPGSGEVVAVTMDPLTNPFLVQAQGVRTLSNFTGNFVRNFVVYQGFNNTNGVFGKAAGLGDVELTCAAVNFLELGNRIWMDANRNGIQDPNEMPISGATAHLYQQGNNTAVATAVTDANGNYRFTSVDTNDDGTFDNDANLTDSVGLVNGAGLLPETSYVIRFDRAADYQSGGVLYGKRLSTSNAGTGTYGTVADLRDSDATSGNTYGLAGGNFPEIVVQHLVAGVPINGTGKYGEVDHTLDVGFYLDFDFGDAPAPFPTLLANSGAQHVIVDGVYLGASVDREDDGFPSAGHDGDDNNGTDDEDGVVISPLIAGQNATIQVTASVAGRLNAWIDYNLNGNWNDPGEHLFTDTVLTAGVNNLTIAVPLSATQGMTCLRFRFTTGTGVATTPTGLAPDGEVEDYPATILKGVSIGNTVFHDANNNGQIDAMEKGINGVTVELFYDADDSGALNGPERTPVATQVTSSGGYYLFTQITNASGVGTSPATPLLPGQYFVGIAASNFNVGNVLAGLHSSGTTANNLGLNNDAAIAGNGTTDSNADNYDDGLKQTAGFYLNGVLSDAIRLTPGTEPAGETTAGMPGATSGATPGHFNTFDGTAGGAPIPDSSSNLTVDFGFYSLSIGNLVFRDDGSGGGIYNNGIRDGAEPPIPNVTVVLVAQNGQGAMQQAKTDANGKYLFTGVAAGKYTVEVRLDSLPAGLQSSADPAGANTPNAADSDDNGVLLINAQPQAVRSAQFMLMPADATATGESDQAQSGCCNGGGAGFGMPPQVDWPQQTDENSDLKVDFAFIPVYSLGNRVWNDLDNNGILNGSEPGIYGVTLRLLTGGGAPAVDVNGSPVPNATTDVNGYYRFDKLPKGDYVVEVVAANFASGVLMGFSSSSIDAGDPDTDADDNDDNGVGKNFDASNGIRSLPITIGESPGSVEPTNETDIGPGDPGMGTSNDQSNLTVDFGFFANVSIGNQVFFDANNNGVRDSNESGIAGVRVELYADANMDNLPDSATPLAVQVTGGNGLYLFMELTDTNGTPMNPAMKLVGGKYLVVIPASNFAANQPLNGLYSSGTTATTNGALTETTAPDPNIGGPNPANPGVDGDDNGTLRLIAPFSGAVLSRFVDVQPGTEPLAEQPDNDPNTMTKDPSDNQTIDFGFYSSSIGNLVFRDDGAGGGTHNNAVRDGNEPPLANVTVKLIAEDGTTTLMTKQTDANGKYLFAPVAEGKYFVEVDRTSGALTGLVSSKDGVDAANPNAADNDDNGTTQTATAVRSPQLMLMPGLLPTGESDQAQSGCCGQVNGGFGTPPMRDNPLVPDQDSTLNVDFGFIPVFSLGNRVWRDLDNSGTINAADGLTPGIAGVKLSLTAPNGDPARNSQGNLVGTVITDASGYYRFDNLAAGNYVVVVEPMNFLPGMPLENNFTSTPAELDPNLDVDNNDNGFLPNANSTVISGTVTLGPASGTPGEPTTDNDPAVNPDTANGEAPNNQSNRTVDFGFVPTLSLGNLVWKDNNNDGLRQQNEPGIDNVYMELFADRNGNGLFEPNGADGPRLAFQQTAGGGLYRFTNLIPGRYFVRVAPSNFEQPGGLYQCFSSRVTNTNPNSNIDNDDNGVDNADPVSNGIASNGIDLIGLDEPDTPVDGDDRNGNQTLDFGFHLPVAVGNYVWKDLNNDGLLNNNEPGVNNVKVELIFDANGNNQPDDAVLATATTLANGFYGFSGLNQGTYFVRIAASNFVTGGALAGCVSSTGNDSGDAVDNNDNGIDNANPQTNGIVSVPISLVPNTEPTNDGDGANANQTIDFGFYPPVNLGNAIWKDLDNNGLKDANEPGINGVTVELYRETNGTPGLQIGGDTFVSSQSTAGGGLYQFTGLQPGGYYVFVPASNFAQPNGMLAGCFSSTPDDPTPDNNEDNDDNGVSGPNGGIVTGIITLTGGAEPVNDGDGADGNQTVDLGFYPPVNVGNLVWKDNNNNGIKDGSEPGIQGVTVELWRDNGDGVFNPATDTQVPLQASATTDASGVWGYSGLLPGNYFARVASAEFTTGGDLAGCQSSTPTEANPNADVDNNDNGIDNPNPGSNGIVTGLITLTGQSEPTNDGDGNNGNLTIDFGFYPPMNLGNLVWKDNNNDGLFNNNEPVMNNVTVELIQDTNNNNLPDDPVVATTQTAGGGLYQFTNIVPGRYFVRIPAAEFAAGGDLVGCVSSTPTEASPNADVDNNDNGIDNANPAANGIVSGAVDLIGGTEPTNDGDGNNGNLTVDFGFYPPMSLGNLIWKDDNNNGLKDANEPGVNGVVVQLYRDNGDNVFNPATDTEVTPQSPTSTTNGGQYSFANLSPGNYFVVLPSSNFTGTGALAGCLSSTVDETNPNGDVDNNDNGLPGPNGTVVTGLITLIGGTEPTNDGDGNNSNQTVDLGFYPPMSLGNLVWKDNNNDGLFNNGEQGVNGVLVELFKDNGDNVFNPATDTPSGTATTAGGGLYQFNNLTPGTYFVRIAASNFAGAGALAGCLSSEPTEANPNADVDNNDNGLDNANPATNGIVSGAVTLLGHSEPINDGDNNNGNQTVDFGFIPLMNLGNLIWKDYNNNGIKDATEPGMNGVSVQLYRDTNGNNQLDLATDQLAGSTTTTGAGANVGQYSFANLPPGNYFVVVPASNFSTGGALAGCFSSTVDDPTPNNNEDNDDNGLVGPNGSVVTGLITLIGHTEPTNDGDGDNGNLTVDLGFYPPMNLGNLVWKDANNDGQRQVAEPGIDGVVMELFKDANANNTFEEASDTLIGTTTTAGGGLYGFSNLPPGVYFVRAAKSNFTGTGVLVGCISSTTTAANPDNDVDNDDNGADQPPSAVGTVSGAITLTGNAEPTTDGDGVNGNLTLDFGFYAPLSLGNLIWKDFDNDGLKDADEPGVNGVAVDLIRDANNNNLPDDAVIATKVTVNGGLYQFTDLLPGDYFVRVAANNFTPNQMLFGCISSTGNDAGDATDNNDNGVDNANPQTNGIVSTRINLSGGTEPPANVDGDGTNGNQTIDFGFYSSLALGNLVWKDLNNDGLVNNGEPGIDGVVVELFRDTNNNQQLDPSTDASAGVATTAGGGLYQFTNLLPGNYFVRVAPVNFTGTGALVNCSSSSVTNANPNSDIDNDDNGIDGANPSANGIASGLVTLVGNAEPTNDGDGANGNQTVDFGFITGSLGLGNLVWKDLNTNGLKDANEPGVANVTVQLLRDANNNNQPDDAVIATTTTNSQGVYQFTSLAPGNYFVRVAASNFDVNGPLYGCTGTPGTNPPNNDADNDDNGSDSTNPSANPPTSGVITLSQNGEPSNDGDGNNSNLTVDFGFVTPLAVRIEDPATCIGPGTVLQVEAVLVNTGSTTQQNNAGPEAEINLPPLLAAVNGSCSSQGGNGTCSISGTQRVTWDGSYAPGERVVIRYRVQIGTTAQAGQQFCITSLANFDADNNGSNESQQSVTVCATVSCQQPGPGTLLPGCSTLIYPVYTSSSTNPTIGNTRINLTNVNPNQGTAVHLFFVDGSTCSVTDAFVCLTANQTTSFLMSDLDPGTTGYLMAVAVDANGCPSSFNWLLGDEYVKFESGHQGNLTADCVTAIPGGSPACQLGSSVTTLNFDGVSYSQLPQTVAVDNIPDRASGNDTLLILNRIGGNLGTGMDKLGSISGLLYNDAENAYSFAFTPNTCQFRSVISNNFPRTAPRPEIVIPAGRSGWMRLYSQSMALTGAVFNRNTNSSATANAFNGGHNLHTITRNPSVSVTMPVFPPSCL